MRLTGTFVPPGDKSISHRLALMALLARGRVGLTNFSPCADVASSLGVLARLGGNVEKTGDEVILTGAEGNLAGTADLDCGNSGTTMRLLMGILAGCRGRYTLDGDESLRRRPMERVAKPLRSMGAAIECTDGKSPVHIKGAPLQGLEYELPVASAQLKTRGPAGRSPGQRPDHGY